MLSAARRDIGTENEEANTFYSVSVELQGRMMREDYTEQKCFISKMSPAVAFFEATHLPNHGERIIAYIEQIGRLEGHVIKVAKDGFEVAINATPRKQNKLAAQLTWLANKHELGMEEDRRHDRESPRKMNSEIRLEDGRTYPVRIIDLSVSGAAFEIDVQPESGTLLWLGSMQGRVIRHFETGISIEFLNIQPIEELENRL